MVNRRLDFKSYYIATVQHLPDSDRQNLIIKLTWSDYYDFSYKVLNYGGDNHDASYFASEDSHFKIIEKIDDTGLSYPFNAEQVYPGRYYFIRVRHRAYKKLHTAVVRVLEVFQDGDVHYTCVSYPFENSFLKSEDYQVELIKYLYNAWILN